MLADPLGYLLTFGTYGTWLPGDGRGWVDRTHAEYGSILRTGDESREGLSRDRMAGESVEFGAADRSVVLDAVLGVCRHRGWGVSAAHVRTNHAHVVASGRTAPERMLVDFKAYATRALRAAGRNPGAVWRRHGSTVYLWTDDAVVEAVNYVLHRQGEPMARWPA